MTRSGVVLTAMLTLVSANASLAQDTTQQKGVRVGLTYQPGVRPGVVVLPVAGADGDSIRAILQRDLDFGDRVEIIGREGTTIADAAAQAGRGSVNYPLWKALGAVAIVQATVSGGRVRVAVHDVAAGRVANAADFPVPRAVASPEWRMAMHGVSDEAERWITGARGIAQTRMAFVRGGRIHIVDSDGASERAFTDDGTALSPAWHPDGGRIAYSVLGPRGTQIVVRDLGSGQTRKLSATPGGLNITPEFSPDGRALVYAHGEENGADLVLTNPSGGSARKITVGRGTDNVSPTFSPDGRRIAFTSSRSGHPEVYIADIDGSNAELLTPFQFGDQNYRSNPSWSADGRLIAFQSQIAGRFQLMTIALRDRGLKQLTSDAINEDPSWAPDSRHVVFTSSRTGTKQLFVLDIETGRTRQLTHGGGARLASWSRILGRVP